MLKIVIISDTHLDTTDKLKPTLIERIKSADVVIHAGDADTVDFISDLKKISKVLYAVRGNCDWGSDLPAKIVETFGEVRVGISHGTGNYNNVIDRMSYLFSDDNVNVIIFGHTHVPVNEDIEGIRFINPGSTHLNRNLNYGTFAELIVDEDYFTSKIVNINNLDGA